MKTLTNVLIFWQEELPEGIKAEVNVVISVLKPVYYFFF